MTFGILALGFPVSEVLQLLQPLGAHSLTFFPIYLPYLHAFLRWRLASWLWGSLFRRFCSFCSLWGSQSHFLPHIFPIFPIPYLHAFLRWRLASWLWGSLFRRFCSFCSLWGLTVSLSSLYLPYLTAFLRWRLASWLWGSLFRRFCSFCSLWGLTVSLSSLYLPYLTAFLRWRLASWLWGSLFCSFCSLWGSQSHFLPYIFPIFMHSLGDVWHRRFCIPIFMHSLGDVWHPGSGVPCFAAFAAFGGSQSHFLPYIFPTSLSSCIP